MPRQFVRGGPWKNSEDEILKAAVMKYGKHQWARVASLLNRKSAKQCKARWYEWLDPSIKKTEWTREEEEKLLHLAKIMPSQWRSIAPIVGRTASQCLEHYERMLDEEQERQEGGSSLSHDDPRKPRVGEIDPNPETKPARPDAIDMDDDELEMLNEARARLSNTRGKKAKRRMREIQLEEGRRVAATQKRRELKAAGIQMVQAKTKKRKLKHQPSDVDYNKEIPFYKKPAPGFYDTTDEDKKSVLLAFDGNNSLEAIQAVQKEQESQQKKKEKKAKVLTDKNLPDIIKRIDALNEPAAITKKVKLALPPPQITDEELDQIAKLGKKMNAMPSSSGQSQATKQLIGDYKASATPMIQPTRTPLRGDTTSDKIRELQQLTTTPTPIQMMRGREGDFINPEIGIKSTPAMVKATPIIHQTPFRDQLNINNSTTSYGSELGEDLEFHKQQLKEGFSSLPTPANSGDFVVFKSATSTTEKVNELKRKTMDDDAGERERIQSKKRIESRLQHLKHRSSVVKRDLPKPTLHNMDMSAYLKPKETNQSFANQLLATEMLCMINNDTESENSSKSLGLPENLLVRAKLELAMECKNYEHLIPPFEVYNKICNECITPITLEKAIETAVKAMPSQDESTKFVTGQLGPYSSKQELLLGHIKKTNEDIQKSQLQLETFRTIQSQEQRSLPSRLMYLKEEASELSCREKELQDRYKSLLDEKDHLKIINLDNRMVTDE